MIIDTWYEWIFTYCYWLGQGLLVAVGLVVLAKNKSIIGFACAIGFLIFGLGSLMQVQLDRAYHEAKQTQSNTAMIESSNVLWRGSGSLGFLIGGGSLLINLTRKRKGP